MFMILGWEANGEVPMAGVQGIAYGFLGLEISREANVVLSMLFPRAGKHLKRRVIG
jgi:hypothetical protein